MLGLQTLIFPVKLIWRKTHKLKYYKDGNHKRQMCVAK